MKPAHKQLEAHLANQCAKPESILVDGYRCIRNCHVVPEDLLDALLAEIVGLHTQLEIAEDTLDKIRGLVQ